MSMLRRKKSELIRRPEIRRRKDFPKQSNDLSGPRSRAEIPRHRNNAAEHRVLLSLWRELLLPIHRWATKDERQAGIAEGLIGTVESVIIRARS